MREDANGLSNIAFLSFSKLRAKNDWPSQCCTKGTEERRWEVKRRLCVMDKVLYPTIQMECPCNFPIAIAWKQVHV